MKITPLLACCGVLFLTACNTHLTKGINQNIIAGKSSTPLNIISQESQQAVNAQKRLLAYQQRYNEMLQIQNGNPETDLISVDYVGKPNPLIASIAIKYGYRFLEYGNPNELPTMNFTNFVTTPLGAVKLVDSRLGDSARIAINQQEKTIVMIYKDKLDLYKKANQ